MQVNRKAYAKINLGLDVIRKREDGYHDVKMIMQSVNVYDELSFQTNEESKINITTDVKNIPVNENNLIYKSAKLMMERFSIKKGITIHLKKSIPVAAGMAGGSTDAAATFLAMNELFELGLSTEELMELGVTIGADVPYCILGGTALSEGIGEKLTVLPNPPECYLVIAKPDIYVSTKYVYEHLNANQLKEHPPIDEIIQSIQDGNLLKMAGEIGNVLETVTAKEYPVIEVIKNRMKEYGAVNALMSGSGPTVFGIYKTKDQAEDAYDRLQGDCLAKQLFVTTFINHHN